MGDKSQFVQDCVVRVMPEPDKAPAVIDRAEGLWEVLTARGYGDVDGSHAPAWEPPAAPVPTPERGNDQKGPDCGNDQPLPPTGGGWEGGEKKGETPDPPKPGLWIGSSFHAESRPQSNVVRPVDTPQHQRLRILSTITGIRKLAQQADAELAEKYRLQILDLERQLDALKGL